MNQKLDFLSKKVLIFAAVISFSLIAAVLIYSFFASPSLPVISPMPTPPGLTNQEVMDKTASLIKAGDINACDSVDKMVNGVNYRTVCRDNILEEQAKKNLDFSACDKTSNSSAVKDACKRNIIGLILKKEGKISACGSVPEEFIQTCKNIYWSNLALEQKNPKPCDNLLPAAAVYSCQSNLMDYLFKRGDKVDCSIFTDKKVKLECMAGGEKN